MLLEAIKLGLQGVTARPLLISEVDGLAVELAEARSVAIRKIGSDRDPLPALGTKGLGFGLQLLDHQAVEQRRVQEPAAIVKLEQIAHHGAAGRLVVGNTDELCHMAARELHPNLLLAYGIVRYRERHELFQRHAILGVNVEECFGNRSKLQPLLDNGRAHEEPGSDLLFAESLLAQGLEDAKLVERVQGNSLDVLGQ